MAAARLDAKILPLDIGQKQEIVNCAWLPPRADMRAKKPDRRYKKPHCNSAGLPVRRPDSGPDGRRKAAAPCGPRLRLRLLA